MKILFQNDHAVLVDKPADWLAIAGRDPKDARPVLLQKLEAELSQKIFAIHRLDAEVTGLILYGKTPEFHRAANQLFEGKTVRKTYQAFTERGPFTAGQKIKWTSKLLRGKKRAFEAPHGKIAITEGEIRVAGDKHLEWRLHPITGRSHQLRFELAKHGSRILGDTLYGAQAMWNPGIALRAIELDVPAEFAAQWNFPEYSRCEPLVYG